MNPFGRYLLNKLFWYLLAFVAAMALNFFLPRLIPGNPVDAIVSQMAQGGGASGEAMQRVYDTYIVEFGLDKSPLEQFIAYLGNLLRGDLGTSLGNYPTSVNSLIKAALPWTLALQLPTILLGWILGNILGALAAYKGGWVDRGAFLGSLAFSSIPYYGLAILLLYTFAVALPWFPTGGAYGFASSPSWTWGFIADAFRHYFLPFMSLLLVVIGGQAIGMRSMAIYELGADYVGYERSLGLREPRIVRGIFRNAMLPQITGLALSIGALAGGALITEIVFSYPGLGTVLFDAIRQNDYPVIQGVTMLITVAVLAANFLVDLTYGLIDPRIRTAQSGAGA
jgi:peptide/nickel transport system permease protein